MTQKRRLNPEELMLSNCCATEDSWESLDSKAIKPARKSTLNIHWKDSCWSWSSNTLATWCEELTHWERPWCWERLKVGGEGDNRWWAGRMASLTRWMWVWAISGSWWCTGKPGMLQSMGLQRVRHDWETEKQQLITLKYVYISTCIYLQNLNRLFLFTFLKNFS